MGYKDLLVHVDEGRACGKRIEVAIRLAAAHGAHLTGLCVMAEPSAFAYAIDLPGEVLEALEREATARADMALKGFVDAAERAGIAYSTRMDRGVDLELPEILALHARHADLSVLGQVDPEDDAVPHRGVAEEITLDSGRPTLVVPYVGAAGTFGERVAVAWNASRESARAVGDAMPVLERARAVAVVSVNPRPARFGHGEQPGADIATHLARHGVNVEVVRLEARDIDVANVILSYLADSGSDLLVMGCYGHSRMREMVLGGVTRSILREMTVPVLMAH